MIHQHIKFHGRMLNGASLAPTSEVWMSPFWTVCCYRIRKYGIEVTVNGMNFSLNFIKKSIGSEVTGGGGTGTDRLSLSSKVG
jgi:hypothetical protein